MNVVLRNILKKLVQ